MTSFSTPCALTSLNELERLLRLSTRTGSRLTKRSGPRADPGTSATQIYLRGGVPPRPPYFDVD